MTIEKSENEGGKDQEKLLQSDNVYEKPGFIIFNLKEHSKIIKVGKPLSFTAIEAHDIAFSLHFIARCYLEKISQKTFS